ncbi:MAG TPA: ABC transporter substrate-binding protein [Chloroflexota bacterium]|nr:ABC transporter substrate-binding protein [Chloroflexota bacterium]
MRPRLLLPLLALGLLASLTAARPAAPSLAASRGPGDAPVAAAVPQLATLRFGTLPVTGFLGLYLANEQGWLAEEGVGVDLQTMSGGAEIVPAMIGGSLDMGATNVFSHVVARDQGFDVKAVAASSSEARGSPTHAIVVRGDSPIQSAQDLVGRTMATNTLNNIDHVMQMTWLQNNGVDPHQVNIVEVPFPQQPAALAQSRVDAIGPTEPFVTVAVGQGGRVLAYHYTETNPVTLIAYYVATGDWLGRNADVARRFARAVHRANAFLAANPDDTRAAAVRLLNLPEDLATRANFEQFETRIDPAGIQWWIDAGRRFGIVTGQPSPQDFLYETVQ